METTAVVEWARSAASTAADPRSSVTGLLPLLRDGLDAHVALLPAAFATDPPEPDAGSAWAVPFAPLVADAAPRRLTRVAADGRTLGAWPLPADLGTLVLDLPTDRPEPQLDTVLTVVDATLDARCAARRLDELTAGNDHAQQLAGMGDFDWHIPTDVTRWSDNMFRIYGHRPGAFVPNYGRFVSMVHPDDRERVVAIHQAAAASHDPFTTTERIVRPDGEVRYLSSSGEVVLDANGTPERIRGTCIDVTDRVRAEQDRERSAARFRRLVESSPDAILLLEGDTIVMANRRAHELLAGDPLGRRLGEILQDTASTDGPNATGLDGAPLMLDVTTAELTGDQILTALYLRDAAPRLRTETVAATLREATVRRTQALELNDAVVQGLTASLMSMQSGDVAECEVYLQRTLQSARQMMNDWLEPLGGQDLRPGDLVRTTDSALAQHPTTTTSFPARELAEPTPSTRTAPRIVIVDDNDDVRRLLRIQIERLKSYAVIGEAADGAEAIQVAAATQPDVVFLDMAMPHMDGLEALPHILKASPDSRVVVLSGFDESSMAPKAMAAGAARYLEKGLRLNFREIIDDVMSAA